MPAKPKCCSRSVAKMKKVAYDKAKKAANAPLGPEGRFAKKVTTKKASAKKSTGRKAKPCTVCGKK